MASPAPIDLPDASGAAAADLDTAELTFIGTATVLLRLGGFTILTDPNFLHAGEHVYLGLGLTSKRRTDPAMELADLPPLDLVLLSHHHGDHFDRVAVEGLDELVVGQPIGVVLGRVRRQRWSRYPGPQRRHSPMMRPGAHDVERIARWPGKERAWPRPLPSISRTPRAPQPPTSTRRS